MNDLGPTLRTEGEHPWIQGTLTDQPMLIIVGGYRCGTTSLFTYLAAHPDIDPALIKEPAFFFSLRIAQRPSAYPAGHEAWAYRSMFRRRNARVLLEATSNYFNDPGCAARIARALPNARIVVLMREPVARLVSWYRFLRLQNQLDPGLGFEAWIRRQLAETRPVDERPYTLQAVAHCRYAPYLEDYLRVFGRDRVLPLWFDDFKSDPRGTLRRVCGFAGIDPRFHDGYAFPVQNESMKLRRVGWFRAYRRLHKGLARVLQPWPRLQHEFKVQLFGRLEPRLLPFFTAPADPVDVPDALVRELRAHFIADLAPLHERVGSPAPWQAEYLAP
ncbi:sulfotransferase [Fontimonas sp. SYSU GA230001]|uniref:sulfotransferase family protein n=1 Tax=Fontimonas sp. SYSU GA230001 TaxID=3142450 RepID=UPI0032B42AB8